MIFYSKIIISAFLYIIFVKYIVYIYISYMDIAHLFLPIIRAQGGGLEDVDKDDDVRGSVLGGTFAS